MHAVESTQSTPAGAVIPYYAVASVSFFIASLLLIISVDSFFGHYFQPRLLSITHLLVLGWGTMTIFGALHQFVPVLLETGLYSPFLSKATFWTQSAGVSGLIYSFWSFNVGWPLQLSSIILFISVLLFSFNIYKTATSTKNWTIAADFIVTSLVWLLLTVAAGVLLAFNFRYVFLPESHLTYLKLHAHLGFAGWFLLLIIGVSSRLIPMFLLSPQMNDKKLSRIYYLINLGLAGYVVDVLLLNGSYFAYPCIVSVIAGIFLYVLNIRRCYQTRVRKGLDAGIRESLIAFLVLGVPLILLIVLMISGTDSEGTLPFYIAYGFSILFGFISTLILGQVYKTLPFIVWLKLKRDGKALKTLPRDLFSESLAKYQMYFHLIGVVVALAGLLLQMKSLFYAGTFSIMISAAAFNVNLFKMLKNLLLKTK